MGQGTACRFGRGMARPLLRHNPVDVPGDVVLVVVTSPHPDSREHLADDDAVTEPSLLGLPLLIVEDPLLVLLPEALVRIEGHLDVEEGPQLAQLQLALRPLGLEDAGEVEVVEYRRSFRRAASTERL